MSLPRYPRYRVVNAGFLTETPDTWSLVRLKRLAREPIKNGVGEPGSFDDPDWPRYVRITDIESPRRLRTGTFASLPPTVAAAAPLRVGDLLFAAVGASYGKSYLHVEDIGPACYAGFMVRFTASLSVLPDFVAYWAESSQYWAQVQSRVVQATIQNFSASKYGELLIALPSPEEQRAIAAFLDRETAVIDALIAEQERLVALLDEKRQAVITQAVTKGLDPNVPLQDSGVEYLGRIPEHWEVKRLRHVCPQVTVGIVVEPSRYYVDRGVPALRSLNVAERGITLENMVFISEESNELLAKSKLNAGDIVAVRSGKPGTAAVVPRNLDGCNCIDLIIIRKPLAGDERFLCYFLASSAARTQFAMGSDGAIQQHFNVGTAMNLIVAVPPVLEQVPIVEYVDAELTAIDRLSAMANEAAELLRERRAALISAAVTGQIDVRGLADGEAA